MEPMFDRYDVVIRRDHGAAPIGRREWESVIELDSELEVSLKGGLTLIDESGHEDHSPDVEWKNSGESLLLFEGAVWSENPTSGLIDKMILLAETLQARVVGERGEIYCQTRDRSADTKFWPPLVGSD